MKTRFIGRFLPALLFAGTLTALRAQPFSVDWSKVAGGSGVSTSAQFSAFGTFGQPDASARLAGGTFSVVGGFWSLIAAVETPGAPRLVLFGTITNTVVIMWPAPSTGFVLQQTATLTSPTWQDVPTQPVVVAGQEEVIISPPIGNQFYRLKK